ncbi:MAG TPA: stilbene synthase [Verrucomicrobiae bacterium]|nr:stilbene synthase [Verrucomicrobiae bacterium]
MFITGLGTAVPEKRYAQAECWEAFSESVLSRQLAPRSRAIVRKVLTGNNGIQTRHLALENLRDAFDLTPNALQERFAKHAPRLAAEAARKALAQAGARASRIDALLVSTCTGYLCPGLTSYVGEQLGLRGSILSLDLVGQGCGAALPNLRAAEALLSSGQYETVLSVCVEVCSAALYFDDDPGVLISACIFGDGAGAAVLSNSPGGKHAIQWRSSSSLMNPGVRDLLRFRHQDGMLRNILSPLVPELAARHVEEVFQDVSRRGHTRRERIQGWVLHPGGRDVLLAITDRMELKKGDTRWSEAVLRDYGNLSSPSVYFVLESAFNDSPSSGEWWMSSFGAGFSCHGALLQVDI